MNKKAKTALTILIIVFIAGIIAYPKVKPLFSSNQKGPGKGGPTMMPARQILNVTGFLIKPTRMIDSYNSIGTLIPDEEVDLSFETSGKIVAIYFTESSRVKKGDLLAKINDKPLQAQLEKLMAQQKLAEEKEFRQRNLLGRDAISQESYDQIVTELQTIQADINLVKARISETELRAPFDGVIGLRYISEGSYTNSSTKIARLVKMSPIKVEFAIPEKYSDDVKKGFPITFSVVGGTDTLHAVVYAVDPKVDIKTRTITMRALYPNNNEELKSGRFAPVTLQLKAIENTIAIPSEAIIPEMEGETVFVLRRGKASSVKVDIGLRTESMIQIVSGLNFGDTLLTSGILQLRQGLPVVLDTLITN